MNSILQQLADDIRDLARMYRENWTVVWLLMLRSGKLWKFVLELFACVAALALSVYILFHTPR